MVNKHHSLAGVGAEDELGNNPLGIVKECTICKHCCQHLVQLIDMGREGTGGAFFPYLPSDNSWKDCWARKLKFLKPGSNNYEMWEEVCDV